MPLSPASPSRFVALDIHKHAVMVGAVDAEQHVVLKPRPIAFDELEGWMRQHLQPTDAVVVEAPANSWQLHDQIAPLVASVIVAHPQLANLMPAGHNAGDPRDTISLARLHAAGLVPSIWVPPPAVRELRALVAYRCRLLAQRAEARSALDHVLRRRHMSAPAGAGLATDQPGWWAALDLPPVERARVRDALGTLGRLRPLIADVESRLAQRGVAEPWAARVTLLMHIPGMSSLSAVVLLSAIGDITRFATAGQLVGYAGLGDRPRDADGGGKESQPAKDGRREIRSTMGDVAWAAVRADERWQATFEQLERRIGPGKAIVAVARKLLLLVWEGLAAQDDRADAHSA
jgi:transposase